MVSKGLGPLYKNFENNLQALRFFCSQIGSFADETDEKNFVDSFEGFRTAMESVGAIVTLGPSLPSEDEDIETIKIGSADEFIDWLKQHPIQAEKFIEWSNTRSPKLPEQGVLLRQSAVINLLIYFEVLLSDLIRDFYTRYPAALSAEDSKISLTELRAFGSIQKAEDYIVETEAETVLRKSLEDQLDYFSKKFKVNLKPLGIYLGALQELTQRRNLLVHTNGVVNRIYLAKVSKQYITAHSITDGQKLLISPEYVDEAIDLVHVAGLILLQQCWRQWDRTTLPEAEKFLNNLCYDYLKKERYGLVQSASEYAISLTFSEQAAFLQLVINRAIALKRLGKKDELQKLLSSHDWSAYALQFVVAMRILKDEHEVAYKLMAKALAAGELDSSMLESWPIFDGIRTDPKFVAMLNRRRDMENRTPLAASEPWPQAKKVARAKPKAKKAAHTQSNTPSEQE